MEGQLTCHQIIRLSTHGQAPGVPLTEGRIGQMEGAKRMR
jgi:hypothetical protein